MQKGKIIIMIRDNSKLYLMSTSNEIPPFIFDQG